MKLPKLTNVGVENAKSEKLIILESDRILPEGYFEEVIGELKPGYQYTTREMVKLTAPATDEDIVSGNYETTCDSRSVTKEMGIKNMWSGNTAIMKSDFYKAGAMDEGYVGYGWGDFDMTYATESVGVESVYKEGPVELHLWHEGATYGTSDQKELFINNCLRFCNKWKQPVPQFMKEEIQAHKKTKFFI